MDEVRLTVCRIQPRFEPWASLSLEGVDPERVSEQLGIPSDDKIRPEVLELLEKEGTAVSWWTLETRGHVRTRKLSDHVEWIAERLSGKEQVWREIVEGASRAELRLPGPDRKWEFDKGTVDVVRERLGVTVVFMMTLHNVEVIAADDLLYRDARAGDAEGISRLLGELGYPVSAKEVPSRLAALKEHPRSLVLVAVDGQEILGVIAAHTSIPWHRQRARRKSREMGS
jgi:hypothetical protein